MFIHGPLHYGIELLFVYFVHNFSSARLYDIEWKAHISCNLFDVDLTLNQPIKIYMEKVHGSTLRT